MSFRRGLLILLAGIVVTLIATRGFEKLLLALSMLSETRQAVIGDAGHSLTYVVSSNRWTVYDLPAGHGKIRVIANASCWRSRVRSSTEDVRFVLRYRVVDSRGRIGRDRVYHLRSRPTDRVPDPSGVLRDRLFFLESEFIPAEGRIVMLDLTGLGDGRKMLQLRMAEADPSVADVVCRVYYEDRLSPARQQFRWERLGKARRERLTRLNVYTPDLLTEEETLLYSRFEWTALAPRGVVGRDYSLRVLYRRREEVDDRPQEESAVSGLRVGPRRRGTIPLPEGENLVTLELVRDDGGADRDDVPVRILWYGRSPGDAREHFLGISGSGARFTRWFEGGILEVRSDAPLSVRAYRGAERQEITPEPRFVRAYITSVTEPVEYEVAHVLDQPTPLRVDLRSFRERRAGLSNDPGPAFPAGSSGEARYEILDERGGLIETGLLACPRDESDLDRLAGGGSRESVSTPGRAFFLLPPAARRFRVVSTASPLLVAAYDRLVWSPKVLRVPEDYYAYSRAQSDERGWFLIRPRGHAGLERRGRSRLVLLQYAPPRPELDVLRGRYTWKGYVPEGGWTARDLLVPLDDTEVEEARLASWTYSEVPIGRELTVKILGERPTDRVRIGVVWTADDARGRVRVDIDNVTRLDQPASPPGGQARLPSVPAGEHVLRVLAPADARVFVSHLAPDLAPRYRRRSAVEIPRGSLTYRMVKDDRSGDALNATLYLGDEDASRLETRGPEEGRLPVCVWIRGPERESSVSLESFTHLDRRYDVRPGDHPTVVSIGGEWERIREGRLFIVPFGDDLPPGEYEVVFHFQEPVKGYMTVSRRLEGRDDDVRIFRE